MGVVSFTPPISHPTNFVAHACAGKMPARKISRFAATRPVAGTGISEKTCSVRRLAPFLLASGGADGYGPPRSPESVLTPAGASHPGASIPAARPARRAADESGRTAWPTGSFL